MANSAQHKEKANRNYSFLQTLLGNPDYPEWKAVAAFYTAVHLVERLRASFNEHSKSHGDRFVFLKQIKKPFTAIYRNFVILYDASMVARYDTRNKFDIVYSDSIVESELIGKHLKAIVDFVDAYFGPSKTAPTKPTSGGASSATP